MLCCTKKRRTGRRGMAAVEAAILLPLLTILLAGVSEMGWYVYCAQELNNSARQGARAAAFHGNSNAEVISAVQSSLHNSMGLEANEITVRLSRLNNDGTEQYQIQNLSENEQGQPIRVMVTVQYGAIGYATNMLGLQGGNLSSYAVMRRRK